MRVWERKESKCVVMQLCPLCVGVCVHVGVYLFVCVCVCVCGKGGNSQHVESGC